MSNKIKYFINISLILLILISTLFTRKTIKRNESEKNSNINNTEINNNTDENKDDSFGLGDLFGNSENFSKGKSFSKSQVYSYSYSNIDGKERPEMHVRKMSTEEYVDKMNKEKPAQIRKYGEYLKKDNDNPAIFKKRASTNVENEELILGDGKEKNTLSEEEFNV